MTARLETGRKSGVIRIMIKWQKIKKEMTLQRRMEL